VSAVNSHKALGRGFDTLLSSDFDKSILLDESERIQKVAIDSLMPNKDQPRKDFDDKALLDLSVSIKNHGILQPLIVAPIPGEPSKYSIVAGERRFRASKLANLKTIPVIVRDEKNKNKLEIALIENIQRVDLSPLEQAASVFELHKTFNITYDEIGDRLGKSGKTLANNVRLLNLSEEAKDALNRKLISEGHARTILSLKDQPVKQKELLDSIIKHSWSVRQAERWVVALKNVGGDDSKTAHKRVLTQTPLTQKLGKAIKAPVSLRRMAKGGKLEISFSTEEDLSRIIEKLL